MSILGPPGLVRRKRAEQLAQHRDGFPVPGPRPSQADPQGGIRHREASLHVSNVALVDPKTGEPTRVGFRIEAGKKVRFAKKSGEVIDG